jgi:hypothetical protein
LASRTAATTLRALSSRSTGEPRCRSPSPARRAWCVAPARDRPLEEHLRLGKAIAALPGRVALIASADNGHAHDPDGPYGFDPAAAAYDASYRRS